MKRQWPSLKRMREKSKKRKTPENENQEKENPPENQAKSVPELAQELGMFPTDVESVLKELQDQGAVECYMHEGVLYAVFKQDVDLTMKTIKDNHDVMYG